MVFCNILWVLKNNKKYKESSSLKGLYVSFYVYKHFLIVFLLPMCEHIVT